MSHVVSSQPSATSPYQPTAIQDTGNNDNSTTTRTRIHQIDSDQGQDDCCIHTRNRNGFCLALCTVLSMCCQSIKNCTEACCDCCANCLNDCCEDKPRERERRYYNQRYRKSGGSNNYFVSTENNDDWGINSLSAEPLDVDVGDIQEHRSEPMTHKSSGHDNSGAHHSTEREGTGHKTCHDSSIHHSAGHDSSGYYTSESTHHTVVSEHNSGTCHSGFDSGGCDSGGGDSGGGGDTGGGGCDD